MYQSGVDFIISVEVKDNLPTDIFNKEKGDYKQFFKVLYLFSTKNNLDINFDKLYEERDKVKMKQKENNNIIKFLENKKGKNDI